MKNERGAQSDRPQKAKRVRTETKCDIQEPVIRDAERMSRRTFIDVTIPELKSACSPYSVSSHKRIERGFVEFVEDYSQSVPMSQELTLRISVAEEPTRLQRQEIREAIRAHYAQQITNLEYKQRQRLVMGTVAFFMGLAVLIATYFFAVDTKLFADTLMVLSWVLLWTAFDIFFLIVPSLKIRQRRYRRLQRADIIFKFKGEQ